MAESKTKKSWYKRWWAIVLFIIIGFAIIGSFSDNNSSTSIGSGSSKDFCKSLIPDRINLGTFWVQNADGENVEQYWSNRDSYGKLLVNETYLWNDGNTISADSYGEPISSLSFSKGRRTGENVNLLYQTTSYAVYVKQNIKEDGTIGEEIYYRIAMVLNPDDKTEEGYKVVQYKCCEGSSCSIRNKDFNQL